ncbi:MAG: SH3 domain-containing protein [Acidaminococcaceae bacterium]
MKLRSVFLVGLLLTSLFFTANPTPSSAAGITKYPPLNAATFWQKQTKNSTQIVLTPNQITNFNQAIISKNPTVYNLAQYSSQLTRAQLQSMLNEELLAEDYYAQAAKVTTSMKDTVRQELNLAQLNSVNPVRYGVTVRRCHLRGLPVVTGWFRTPADTNFDLLQETALDPGEPVIILHTSSSGNFFFVQMRNYRGWLARKDVATTTREQCLSYDTMPHFLTVLAPQLLVTYPREQVLYQMGSKLKLTGSNATNWQVLVPTATTTGTLEELPLTMAKTGAVRSGYLPYTRANVLEQAFKFNGAPYGWGGLKNSVDCSSFIADVYRTVGIYLPRNADEQEVTSGTELNFTTLKLAQRQAALFTLSAGDLLYLNGLHTMLYLGATNQQHYCLHALGSYYKQTNTGLVQVPILQVVVSDLSLQLSSGKSFLATLTTAKSLR